MPTFKVKSPITHGKMVNDKVVTKDYVPGDTIEMTKDEASEVGHALVDPPPPARVRGMDKEARIAYESEIADPLHPDSGVVLKWKQDNAVIAPAPPPGPSVAPEPVPAGHPEPPTRASDEMTKKDRK